MYAILQWFDDPRWLRLGMTLLHFVWQGALLSIAAAMLMSWMRGATSHRRYAVLLIVLTMMAAAPVATYFLLPGVPGDSARSLANTAIVQPETRAAVAPALTDDATARIATASGPADKIVAAEPTTSGLWTIIAEQAATAWRWTAARLSWFVAAWLAGVVFFAARFALGLKGARQIRRVGITAAPEACRLQSAELSERLGLRRAAEVFESALVQVPVVVGYLRPVVLMPAAVLAGLPEAELRAILAHELAHIRRQDFLINMLQSVVESLLFYHPAVWWISRAIRQEREQCCDDLAAEACGDRVVVAKALVRLAEVRAVPTAAMAATRGRLAERVRRLIGAPGKGRESAAWRSAAGSSLAGLAAVLAAAFCLCSGGFVERSALAHDAKPTAIGAPDSAGGGDNNAAGKAPSDQPEQPFRDVSYLSKLFVKVASDGTGSPDDRGFGSGGSVPDSADADRLAEQLRRLEQQNEETRRALRRVEEQLKATQKTPPVAPPLRRVTEADIRQAQLFKLRDEEQAESAKLNGKWTSVPASADGDVPHFPRGQTWEFRDHEVALNSSLSSANESNRSESRGLTYFINPLKSPKEMTIVGKGMLIQAIYKLEGDTLTICFFGRSEIDRPTSFKPTKDNALPLIVSTFHRADREEKQSR